MYDYDYMYKILEIEYVRGGSRLIVRVGVLG